MIPYNPSTHAFHSLLLSKSQQQQQKNYGDVLGDRQIFCLQTNDDFPKILQAV